MCDIFISFIGLSSPLVLCHLALCLFKSEKRWSPHWRWTWSGRLTTLCQKIRTFSKDDGIKSRKYGFKRPIKMIETRKYSTLKGLICNRDYSNARSISWYFIANEFDFFLHTCASTALRWEGILISENFEWKAMQCKKKYFHSLCWSRYHINLRRKRKKKPLKKTLWSKR